MLGKDIARDHYPVFIHGREMGHVTSGRPSITLKKNIGLAYLPAENASIGTTFHVAVRSKTSEARVVRTPFYTGTHTRTRMTPDDLLFTKEHEWLRIAGDTGVVGISDHAQKELGELVYIELPKPGTKFNPANRSAASNP